MISFLNDELFDKFAKEGKVNTETDSSPHIFLGQVCCPWKFKASILPVAITRSQFDGEILALKY